MNAAEIETLWKGAHPAIFSADVGRRAAEHDGRVCVFPMKNGSGFMMIVWRGDVSPTDNSISKCIRDGGLCLSLTRDGAIHEALDLLLKHYP